jgi:hypothetical protein
MNNNSLPLVTFEQAKRLKAAGFNLVCCDVYCSNGDFAKVNYDNWNSIGGYSAPSVALSLEWMREAMSVPCSVEILYAADKDGVTYQGRYVWSGKGEVRSQAFGRHRDAASKLLDLILNEFLTLIERGN